MSILVCFGLVFTFLAPPFQKPDEVFHFKNVVSVVGELRNFPDFLRKPKVYEQECNLHNLLWSGVITSGTHVKFPISLYKENFFLKNENLSDINSKPGFSLFLQYFPAIIGYLLSFGYPLIGFFLARLFSLLFFLLCFHFSMKFVGDKYKGICVVFAFIPMLWHQVSGITYDATFISLALLLCSFLIYLLDKKKISIKEFSFFLLISIWISYLKGGNDIFLFFWLLIPLNKIFGKNKKRNFIVYLIVMALLFTFLFLKKSSLSVLFHINTNNIEQVTSAQSIGSVDYKRVLFTDVGYLTGLIQRTFNLKFDFYFTSFLGQFGWLDYGFNFLIYLLIVILLILIFVEVVKNLERPILNWFQLILLSILLFLYIGMIFGGMYLWWTPVESPAIEGVQGRYFLPIFPFILFLTIEFFLKIGKCKLKKIVVFGLVLLILASTISIVYRRYYDYSKLYQNPDSFSGIQYESNRNLISELINKETNIELEIGDNKFSGFQIVLEKVDGEVIPVKYEITSGGTVLQSGYIIPSELSERKIYTEEFSIKESNTGVINLMLKPILNSGVESNYMRVLKDVKTGSFLVNLLQIAK